ncbi:hypothetical protein [Pseudocolwellia agarivorans]|uniref:hypothetical protein n=1 Tax=Pseudocolwellia agarivorans TaxID=1911682 RepID=UPI00098451DC|nr:hypothetical protein [Pseudocolwellia agarivorans]
MKYKIPSTPILTLALASVAFSSLSFAQCNTANRTGDPNWVYDSSKNDPAFSAMQQWKNAGVQGGIPCKESVPQADIVWPTNTIQGILNLVDEPADKKPVHILIKSGTYYITEPIKMKTGVVLRGESKTNTKIIVRLKHKFERNDRKRFAFIFENVENSGIENLTIKYEVKDANGTYQPLDRNNYTENYTTVPGEAWPWINDVKVKASNPNKKNPIADDDLYVGFMLFTGNTKNSWVQDTRLLEAGTDPIAAYPNTRNLTFRHNDIYRCYNKGGEGNCYYDIRGKYILVAKERVRKIRHVAVQKGARFNVLYKNNFEVDVNFHDADLGYNLIEGNSIKLPHVHFWNNISTGAAAQHQPPGPNNTTYKNSTDHKRAGKNNVPWWGSVYKVITFDDVNQVSATPAHGTLYPMKFN